MAFFLDNVSLKYSDYDPNNYRDLAFVPAVRGSEKVLAKPFEVRGSRITISLHLSLMSLDSCMLAPNGRRWVFS